MKGEFLRDIQRKCLKKDFPMDQKPVIAVIAVRDRAYDDRFGEKNFYYVNTGYIQGITDNGGIPMMIPYSTCVKNGKDLLDLADGVIFPGGNDVNPLLFHEAPSKDLGPVDPEIDNYLYELMLHALEKKMPMMGICKGMQLLNVVMGGTLYQDLSHRKTESISHLQAIDRSFQYHEVKLSEGSLLREIFQKDTILTNSLHHQAIRRVAPLLEVSGVTEDGLIEAVESRDLPLIGVQWHPEDMILNPANVEMNDLFSYFIRMSFCDKNHKLGYNSKNL